MSNEFTIKQLSTIDDVSAGDWNAITGTTNPFIRHEYLSGLEKYDCLNGHGWVPCHLVIYSETVLVGVFPLYLRSNSYGEFVFDWAWADAFERAGGRYYPKLVSAIPFAPVLGPRILAIPGHPQANTIRKLLLNQALNILSANNLSSFHCLFSNETENFYRENKLMQRLTVQYHWQNLNYRDFDDFLDTLTSKKRKQLRRERNKVLNNNLEIHTYQGDQMDDKLWEIYYEFYCSTFYKRWGNPRLTKEFFKSLSTNLPDQTLVIMAKSGSKNIAGSFLMKGSDTLYGRHWGCVEQHPYLHFELCYYQPMQYCIENGIKFLDAGVQGEHKLMRGFMPIVATSYHWIENRHFRKAINDYLNHEKNEINIYVNELISHLPYKYH